MPSFHDQDLSRSLGLHRVLEPHGVLPQPAWKLDNTPIVHATEAPADVDTWHIDEEHPAILNLISVVIFSL